MTGVAPCGDEESVDPCMYRLKHDATPISCTLSPRNAGAVVTVNEIITRAVSRQEFATNNYNRKVPLAS